MTAETRPHLMMLREMPPEAMALLEQRYTLHRLDLAEDKDALLSAVGPHCRALAAGGRQVVTPEILEAMPALELVACGTAGFDGFAVDKMAERGIKLTNASRALVDDVSDAAILLMLAAMRGLVEGDAWVRSGNWATKGWLPLYRSPRGKKLGVVGMGQIGKAVAQQAQGFGMTVSYWNRREKPVPFAYQPDLLALAQEVDVLVVIVAGGAGTQGLISQAVLEALGPQGLLVNVARGSVVDEEALISALSDGRLGHAALDVFASEPDPDPRLTGLANTTLYPHHASGTVETRQAMAMTVVESLEAFFAGQPLPGEVDLSGYRG